MSMNRKAVRSASTLITLSVLYALPGCCNALHPTHATGELRGYTGTNWKRPRQSQSQPHEQLQTLGISSNGRLHVESANVQRQMGHNSSMAELSQKDDSSPECRDSPLIKDTEDSKDFPVDVVYTWIHQPSDKEYKKIKKDCPNLKGGWQRMRNLHTLRFSMRMLEFNMPWIRQVFIVTGKHAPPWLNTSNPRVTLVKQEDLWPEKRLKHDKPIHNSQSVEVHLHRIEGLSKHFIYFNDDMFVGRPLKKSFFFTDKGRPVLHGAKHVPMYQDWCHDPEPGNLPVNGNFHECMALTIPMIQEVQSKWPAVFHNISSTHCRGDLPVEAGPTWRYGWYGMQSGIFDLQEKAKVAWMSEAQRTSREEWYFQQLNERPEIGCINDDFAVKDERLFMRELNSLVRFIETYSGNVPSEFEKQGPVIRFPFVGK